MPRRPVLAVSIPVRHADSVVPYLVMEAGYREALTIIDADVRLVAPPDTERARRVVDGADGLLLTGGEDVSPGLYGEEMDGAEDVSLERDEVELAALDRALSADVPVLAICRGIQLLNVALGGSLYQDLESHGREHPDYIDHDRLQTLRAPAHRIVADGADYLSSVLPAGDFPVNSYHHQGIRELGEYLRPVARADDGLVEAVELHAPFGDAWVAGVQWHPERMLEGPSDPHGRLFDAFGRVLRRRAGG